jgi:hypothetical protein
MGAASHTYRRAPVLTPAGRFEKKPALQDSEQYHGTRPRTRIFVIAANPLYLLTLYT